MKSVYYFLALTLLPIGRSLAQTGPTGSSTTNSPAPNRQQELYDQYHGITKKPATTTPSPDNRADQQRSTSKPVPNTPARSTEASSLNRPQRLAADGSSTGVRIGIRGGITYPVFTETIIDVDPKVGFVGGLTFNLGAGHVSFQPEINYARYANQVTNFITYKNAIDVLEVPLFLKLSTGTYAGSRFFLNVGPYATYVLSASVDGKKQSLDGAKGRFGFGAGAGVGAAVKAGPGHVTFEVRGLYPLGDTDNGFNTDSKTIFGQGTLGYIFPLGSR